MIESGFPDVVFAPWYAMYAPAGTPPAIVETLTAAAKRTLADPGLRSRLANAGTLLEFVGPDELTAYTRAEIARFRAIVAAAGVTAN